MGFAVMLVLSSKTLPENLFTLVALELSIFVIIFQDFFIRSIAIFCKGVPALPFLRHPSSDPACPPF